MLSTCLRVAYAPSAEVSAQGGAGLAAGISPAALAGWDDECVLDRLLLKADNLREAQSGQQLQVEDLLHRCLELQQGDDSSIAQVHNRCAALQFVAPLC